MPLAVNTLSLYCERLGPGLLAEPLNALSNLALALPELSRAERRRIVRESYEHFSQAMSDLFWSPRLTTENLHEIFELEDLERLKREQGTERQSVKDADQSIIVEPGGLGAQIDRSRFHAGREKLKGACNIATEAVEQREIIGARDTKRLCRRIALAFLGQQAAEKRAALAP